MVIRPTNEGDVLRAKLRGHLAILGRQGPKIAESRQCQGRRGIPLLPQGALHNACAAMPPARS